jgi:hypothetical protein
MTAHARIQSKREETGSSKSPFPGLAPGSCARRGCDAGPAEPTRRGHEFGLIDVLPRPGRFVQRQVEAPTDMREEEQEVPLQPGELAAAATGGGELRARDRERLESHFGADLSGVRLHADARAHGLCRQLNARAFAYGDHVFFREGNYRPESPDGRFLLAHELSHVMQQRSGRAHAVDGSRLEHEANGEARAATAAPRELAAPTRERAVGQVKRVQRWRYATAADANPLPGAYVVVPAAHRARVNAAMAIIERIVNDRANFGACHQFFEDNCPGGGPNTLTDELASAIVWRRSAPPADMLASSVAGTDHIAYARSFPVGRWAVAASFIHELIHTCGQASHAIGDDAKAACGRLPNI